MSANTFGQNFRITSFGESHGPALGVVVDGCPAGVPFDLAILNAWLERRRPGLVPGTSPRQEPDQPEILSGVFLGKTLGTPIAVVVRNTDQRSDDYKNIAKRAGHADDVWLTKFGHSDPRGGGRSSGRETVARVIGGACAQMLLREVEPRLTTNGFLREIGDVKFNDNDFAVGGRYNLQPEKWRELEQMLGDLQQAGDSVGGVIEIVMQNPPAGLGQPVFHKLKADLSAAMMSVGACAGVELGDGFRTASTRGTALHGAALNGTTQSGENPAYGGIRGGISTGEAITLKVAIKPTSSILNVAKKGRHDPCVALRALVVFEAMASLVLADHILWRRLDRV